jgi:hypothetical protein
MLANTCHIAEESKQKLIAANMVTTSWNRIVKTEILVNSR